MSKNTAVAANVQPEVKGVSAEQAEELLMDSYNVATLSRELLAHLRSLLNAIHSAHGERDAKNLSTMGMAYIDEYDNTLNNMVADLGAAIGVAK